MAHTHTHAGYNFENGFLFIVFPSFLLSPYVRALFDDDRYRFFPCLSAGARVVKEDEEEENWATTNQKEFFRKLCVWEKEEGEDQPPPQVRQKRRASERERGYGTGNLIVERVHVFPHLPFLSFSSSSSSSSSLLLARWLLSFSLGRSPSLLQQKGDETIRGAFEKNQKERRTGERREREGQRPYSLFHFRKSLSLSLTPSFFFHFIFFLVSLNNCICSEKDERCVWCASSRAGTCPRKINHSFFSLYLSFFATSCFVLLLLLPGLYSVPRVLQQKLQQCAVCFVRHKPISLISPHEIII